MSKLLDFKKISGANLDPGHLFPITETYFIKLKTKDLLEEEIIIECVNPEGILYVPILNKILVNGFILKTTEYEDLRKKLQSVKIILVPLIQALSK